MSQFRQPGNPFSQPANDSDAYIPPQRDTAADADAQYGGYGAAAYFALVDQVAAEKSSERRQERAAAFFPGDPEAQVRFMQSVQLRMDLIAADTEAAQRQRQEEYDEDARMRAQARERVQREQAERRMSGELTPAASVFLDAFRADLMGVDGMMAQERPEPLIDGLLYMDSLAWLGGPSNTYKSFLALDIAARYSSGVNFYHNTDMPMQAGRSMVIVAEGAGAYGDRIRAWQHSNGPMRNIDFYGRALQLGDLEKQMPALLAYLKHERAQGNGYGLIVFDTQAMCTVGVNENDNSEMGVIMNVLHQLREATGACVLLVHHFGSDSAKGMRGATAIYAAATTVIAVKAKKQYQVVLSTEAKSGGKQKDAEAMTGLLMDLEQVRDPEGQWSSLVPRRGHWSPDSDADGDGPAFEPNEKQAVILAALRDTAEVGGMGVSAIAREVTQEHGPNPAGKAWPAQTAAKWMNTLVRHGLVEKKGVNYVLTDAGSRLVADE